MAGGDDRDGPTTSLVQEVPRAADDDGFYLLVFDGDSSFRRALPRAGELLLGRGEEAGLRVRDTSVSRRHARLEVAGGAVRIVDLGSHNGVTVNGARVDGERLLQERDVIAVGKVTIVLHAGGGGERAAPAPAAATARTIRIGDRDILIGDPDMERVYALLARLAASDLPILINGETGTGKEVAAAAVHHGSRRRARALLAVNCAALPETLAEGELFGYERGAFSGAVSAKPGLFEAADGGTLFLDEIGEVSPSIQAKLLRAVETGKVMRLGDVKERPIDVRIVAATHRDLERDVATGRFREDLYFRLSAATVWLPPLRERGRELLLLARAFVDDAARKLGRPAPALSPGVLAAFAAYRWPGNVRELRNSVEYAVAAGSGDTLLPDHLPDRVRAALPGGGGAGGRGAPSFRPIEEERRELERSRMAAALAACDGNQSKAAAMIGMPRRTFVAKLKQYKL